MKVHALLALSIFLSIMNCSFIFQNKDTIFIENEKHSDPAYQVSTHRKSNIDENSLEFNHQMNLRRLDLLKKEKQIASLRRHFMKQISDSKTHPIKKKYDQNKENDKNETIDRNQTLVLRSSNFSSQAQRKLNTQPQPGALFEPTVFEALLEVSGGNQIVPVLDSPGKWTLAIKGEDGSPGDPVCEIELSDGGDKTHLIHINNTEIKFLSFWKRTSMKQVGEEETNKDVKDFLDSQFLLFVNDYAKMLQSQVVVVDLGQFFIDEVFGEKKLKLGLVAEATNELKQPNVMYLGYTDHNTGEAAAEIQIYRVNDSFNQINLLFGDQEISFQVPVILQNVQRENLKKELQEIVVNKLQTPIINLEIALEIFETELRTEMNCMKFFVQREDGNCSYLQIPSQQEPCVFGNMTFVLTGFDYGFAKYIHIMVDNELFKSENMVALTGYDQYKETLGQIFADMVELKSQMDQKESQPESAQELTIDDIAKLVTDNVHVALEREDVSDLETVFTTEQHNSKKKLVKIMLKDSKEEKFFKVMMFPLHNGMIGKHTHDEVMIYSNAKSADIELLKRKLERLNLQINGQLVI